MIYIVGDAILFVDNSIFQSNNQVNIHLYSTFSTYKTTILCVPGEQCNIYWRISGYAGLTFICNGSVAECQIDCGNKAADIRSTNGNMSDANISLIADIDSSTLTAANSSDNIIIRNIFDNFCVYCFNSWVQFIIAWVEKKAIVA